VPPAPGSGTGESARPRSPLLSQLASPSAMQMHVTDMSMSMCHVVHVPSARTATDHSGSTGYTHVASGWKYFPRSGPHASRSKRIHSHGQTEHTSPWEFRETAVGAHTVSRAIAVVHSAQRSPSLGLALSGDARSAHPPSHTRATRGAHTSRAVHWDAAGLDCHQITPLRAGRMRTCTQHSARLRHRQSHTRTCTPHKLHDA
jgi:hypothetical protein